MKQLLLSALASFLLFTASAQWLNQNAGFTNDTLGFYEMSLPDKNTAWAVCYDGKRGLLSGRSVLDFTRTTNEGNTWIPGKMGSDRTLRFSNISAIDGQEAWVAMHKMGPIPNSYTGSFSGGGGVFHTSDSGLSWEHTNPGELFDHNSVPRFVHFKDKNHGIAMGDPNGGYFEVYLTNNKGKKWKRVLTENLPAPLANETGWISGYAVVGNNIWFGTNAGRMYKSIDFGENWTVHIVDSLLGTYVHEIAFLDNGLVGVAHLRNSTRTFVLSTTDGGLTWTNYFQPANWKNSRVTAVPGTNAFVSTSVHNPTFRGSAVSYDAGQTWREIEKTASKAVCRFFDANTGYAGGFFVTGPPLRGGIFKSQIIFELNQSKHENISGSQSERQTLITADKEVQVYPTPAKNFINVALDEVLVSSKVLVSLLNTNGKLIEQRRSEGSKIVQFNVSSLPAGLYIIRINANGQTINKTTSIVR